MTGECKYEKQLAEEAARRESLLFNTEAARAGLFASALDILEVMKANGVAEGPEAIMNGAIEFAVQLWDKTMTGTGSTKSQSREKLNKRVVAALAKSRRDQQPATEQ